MLDYVLAAFGRDKRRKEMLWNAGGGGDILEHAGEMTALQSTYGSCDLLEGKLTSINLGCFFGVLSLVFPARTSLGSMLQR